MENQYLTFVVPPGIGDISWVYSKVADLAKTRPVAFKICENPPHRSKEYVDLLPNIINLGYTGGNFHSKKDWLPLDTDLSTLENGTYFAFLNSWLESGVPLNYIFPKQTTQYHYLMNIGERSREDAKSYLSAWGKPKIGFYASSSVHRSEYQFWSTGDWAMFMGTVASMFPDALLVAIGAKFDDRTDEVFGHLRHNKVNAVSAVGETDIGTTIEIIRGLDYFFAFPSGLGILADVVDTPCQMWYWGCQQSRKFLHSYADPKNVESKRHTNLFYCSVSESIDFFLKNGISHISV